MDRHVLLVFFLFCCFEAGTALRCITCHLHLTSDRCRRGFGVCVAQKEEKCMTLNVYDYDWNLQLSYMVCQRFCRALTFHRHGRVFVHKCCEYNYCNHKLWGTGASIPQEGGPERPSAATFTSLL